MRSPLATFLFAAPDQPGLVARLAGFFYGAGLNIVDAKNHTDPDAEGGPRFFMRLVVDLAGLASPPALAALGGSATRSALQASFAELCGVLSASWSVGYDDHVPRVAVLVTKDPACLYDLVLRQRTAEIVCEIPLIVSNHPTLEAVAQSFAIPFYCLPLDHPRDGPPSSSASSSCAPGTTSIWWCSPATCRSSARSSSRRRLR